MTRRLSYIIDEKYRGKTVKFFLQNRLNMSTSVITQMKRIENGIMLNGNPVFVSAEINNGDLLELIIDDGTDQSDIVPVKGSISIIYEDDDMLVVDKPPYMPVHPSLKHPYDSLGNYVMNYYQEKGERFVFRCVNRLDRNTSGLVVIAKNAYTQYALRRQAETGQMNKTYIALVHGDLPDSGTIDAPIKREEAASIKRIVSADGLPAVTHYRTIARKNGLSFAEVTIETGRTHQIRVHMAYIGHPLAGDFLYGDEHDGIAARQALHLKKIELLQPFSGSRLCFESTEYDFSGIIGKA